MKKLYKERATASYQKAAQMGWISKTSTQIFGPGVKAVKMSLYGPSSNAFVLVMLPH